jgi:GNAT superfamily N-acetyltransferase
VRSSARLELESLRSFFAVPGAAGEIREVGQAIAVRADGVAGPPLNRILGLDDIAVLDELVELVENRPFWVAPEPEAGLDQELTARDFVPDGAWQRFTRGVDPFEAKTELDIGDARAPRDFAAVVAETWRLPPPAVAWMAAVAGDPAWHCLVAYDVAKPVAAAALFTSGDLGWLGIAATLESHRGRGAQSTLLAARIRRASGLGLRVLVTETDAPGDGEPVQSFRNVIRAGFEPEYVRANYASPR